jgi:hypothetical protein
MPAKVDGLLAFAIVCIFPVILWLTVEGHEWAEAHFFIGLPFI